MSKYVSSDLREKVKKQLDEIERFKRILSEKEINEKIEAVDNFYGNKENKGKVYSDNTRIWLFLQTPAKEFGEDEDGEKIVTNKPIPSKSKFSAEPNFRWRCVCALGEVTVFATKPQIKQLGWDSTVLVTTGKITTQYTVGGGSGFFKNLEEVAEAMNIATVEELSEDLYSKSYTINIFQVIG